MFRTMIGGALVAIVCAAVFAQGTSKTSPLDGLSGKYIVIYSDANAKSIVKSIGIESIGGRSFIVSPTEPANGPAYTTLYPVDAVQKIEVHDTLESATGRTTRVANIAGVVTCKGKPLTAELRLHSKDGVTYSFKSDSSGRYRVTGLPIDTYTLSVDSGDVSPKYRSAEDSPLRVELKAGANEMDFSLD
jgi:hypothetical protein